MLGETQGLTERWRQYSSAVRPHRAVSCQPRPQDAIRARASRASALQASSIRRSNLPSGWTNRRERATRRVIRETFWRGEGGAQRSETYPPSLIAFAAASGCMGLTANPPIRSETEIRGKISMCQ